MRKERKERKNNDYIDYFVVIAILLQALLVITINTEITARANIEYLQRAVPFLNMIIVIMCVVSLASIKNVGKNREYKIKAIMMRDHLIEVEELIKTLQGERHEYTRHLQAIQSLMEIGRIDEAIAYMDGITEGIPRQYEMYYIDHPALSTLLNSKKVAAERQGIDVAIAVKCELSSLDIPSVDICSIVGNLVDNALEAAAEDNSPRVGVEFTRAYEFYIIYIYNNGATIPRETDIFEAGFSTKTPDSRGYGLYVVKKLVEKYHGQIEITSNKDTGIWVKLPVRESSYDSNHVQKDSSRVGKSFAS